MKVHELTCHPDSFCAIWYGLKTHMQQHITAGIETGDILDLEEVDHHDGPTGRSIMAHVRYLEGGLDSCACGDHCFMSIEVFEKNG